MGCEAWDDRILEIVEVVFEGQPTILGISNVPVLGNSLEAIEEFVLVAIEQSTGRRPSTLSFELVESVLELKPLIDPHRYSTKALNAGVCPPQFDYRNQREIRIEDQIEQIRLEELSRSVV